ncbi:MAG TPA: hypothetical protein VLA72_09900 [Anaerolineales bacterium]|nr:hypothetical protein [Anaerolineales bacterium]
MMNKNRMQLSLIIMMIFAMTACAPGLTSFPSPTQTTPPPSPIEIFPTYPFLQETMTQPSQNQSTPSPEVENLIEQAKENLAHQLSISITDINLIEAQEVVWSDSSLGCPNPSVMYLQVLTPGYLIRLQALGKQFEFHADQRGTLINCPNPSPPLPGGVQTE